MDFILQPWQLFFMILAGWVNREQGAAIDYVRTENQVLKEKLGNTTSAEFTVPLPTLVRGPATTCASAEFFDPTG
jgi:hypothetical protein